MSNLHNYNNLIARMLPLLYNFQSCKNWHPILQGPVRPSEPNFDSSKACFPELYIRVLISSLTLYISLFHKILCVVQAFTGSIVERTHNIDSNPRGQSSSTSKTVSRFKMQRKQPWKGLAFGGFTVDPWLVAIAASWEYWQTYWYLNFYICNS